MAEQEEKVQPLDKKKVETVKYLLSSLFARKQKYLIVDGNCKNRLIYANFPYERVIYYRSTPEDSICGVTVNDSVVPVLHEAFPIFEKVVAELELMSFMAAFNKSLTNDKTKWLQLRVDKDSDKIYADIPPPAKKPDEGVSSVEVGRLLPPDSLKYYESIMDNFMSFVSKPLEMDIELPQGHFDDPVILTDLTLPGSDDVRFMYPMKDGLSMVSFKEYLKKRSLPIKYHALVQYKPDSKAARISFRHIDDWVDCMTIMPGTMWFPYCLAM